MRFFFILAIPFAAWLFAGCASTAPEVIQAHTPWSITGTRPNRAVLLYLDSVGDTGLSASTSAQTDVLVRLETRGLAALASVGHLPATPKINFEVLQTGKLPRHLNDVGDFPASTQVTVVPPEQLGASLHASKPGDVIVAWGSHHTPQAAAQVVASLQSLEKALEAGLWNETLLVIATTPAPLHGEKSLRSPIVDPLIDRFEARGALGSYWLKTSGEREQAKFAMRLKFQPTVKEVYTRPPTAGGAHYIRTYRSKELASHNLSYSELIETLPTEKGPQVIAVLDSKLENPFGQSCRLLVWSPNLKRRAEGISIRLVDLLPGTLSVIGRPSPESTLDGDAAKLPSLLETATP